MAEPLTLKEAKELLRIAEKARDHCSEMKPPSAYYGLFVDAWKIVAVSAQRKVAEAAILEEDIRWLRSFADSERLTRIIARLESLRDGE